MKRAAAAALLSLLWGVGHGQSAPNPAAAGTERPAWLVALQNREATVPPAADVASDDGWFQARLPGGAGQKITFDSGSYGLEVKVDGDRTISCEVLRGSRDMAALLAETAEITMTKLGRANGTIEARFVEASDAGAVGPYPYLALRWLYRAKRGEEVRVGGLKQMAVDLGVAVVYCANDDLGYVKTFDAVTRALAQHLRVEGKPIDTGVYGEISTVTIQSQAVGVSSTVLRRDADGDFQTRVKSALLLQRTPGQLAWTDSVDIEWTRPDGSLINAQQVKGSQGRLTEDLALKRRGGEGWQATGTLEGKPVDFAVAGEPTSHLSLLRARRQLLAQGNPSGTGNEASIWSSLDPSRLITSKLTILGTAGPGLFTAREELGGFTIEQVLDSKTGSASRARLSIGPLQMDIARVHQYGHH